MEEFVRWTQQCLDSKYVVATAIPLLLILVVGPVRKLTRGTKGWKQSDFYLGMDLALGAFTTNLVYISEGLIQNDTTKYSHVNFERAIIFTSVIFFVMFVIMSIHQDWEVADDQPWPQRVMLLITANFLGAGLLLSFILFIKGV